MKAETVRFIEDLLTRLPELQVCMDTIIGAFDIIKECYSNNGKVLACGNGGSAADSEHIVSELMKGFLLRREISESDRERIKKVCPDDWEYLSDNIQESLTAISLVSHPALSTAFCNDVSPDMVFAQQVYGYANEGDVLVCLSTSGNSKNVVNAVKIANSFDVKTIGFTGSKGGMLKNLCNVVIQVPASETFRAQEYHLSIYHTLCAMLEEEFFG